MTIKGDMIAVAVAGGALVLGAWYMRRKIDAAGQAVADTAQATWDVMQTPIDSLGPANMAATNIVEAPSNALDALSFGLIGRETGPGSSVLDLLKAGPFGGLIGMLSGDGNTNMFGPAPDAGIDYGNPNAGW